MSSSPSPSTVQRSGRKKKHKDKGKSKEKTSVQAPPSEHGYGKNEGVDPNWAYRPPNGMVRLDTSQVDEEFDWDSLDKNDNRELWIVRVPEGFKSQQLDGLQIPQPINTPGAKLSSLERKRAKYDIWSAESFRKEKPTVDDDERPPKGEEIQHVSCLLPRKKKNGKLFIAPKPIAQHIIITHVSATPNIDNAMAPTLLTRHSAPKHLLKHRFLPFGASSPAEADQRSPKPMDVDVTDKTHEENEAEISPTIVEKRTPEKRHGQSPEKVSKKRKNTENQGETPKQMPKKIKH